ncbi:MAG: hypothetical protein GXC75_07415 [Xanthomonadaceae bacterium]|nr:hypothetical protein [Xanthomonadaceae bacterium]
MNGRGVLSLRKTTFAGISKATDARMGCARNAAGAFFVALIALPAPLLAFQTRALEDLRAEQMRLHQQWIRLEAMFDPEATAAALAPGEGSLRGVIGFRQRSGLRKQNVTADREWVQLFPMTPYMQEMVKTFRMEGDESPRVHQRAARYSARVITDTKGNFEFHGLKPGRYFLISKVPYGRRISYQVDSGERQISYSPMFGTGSITPIYSEVRTEIPDTAWITRIVEVKAGSPTLFQPSDKPD